tara:strand:- start:1274 stop:1843 length:570 start_codon:yes stop_codon:yes gene_type:complete
MKKLIKINLNQTVSKAQLDYIKEEQQRWIIFGVICSLILISIIWFGATNYRLNYVISSRMDTIAKIKEDTEKLRKGGKINLSKRDIKTLNKFEDNRMFWAPKLIALSEITPDDMAITDIEFENKRLRISAVSSLSKGQKEFSVVEDFMSKIEENEEFNKDFKDIKFDELEKAVVRNQEILSFRIEGRLK